MKYLLVDNGSLRADSVLNLRHVAEKLSELTQLEILPASLLHSSKVDPSELNGIAAVNLEKRIRLLLESGERAFTIIPFFIGPSGAIVDYLPQRIRSLRERFGEFSIQRTPFLYVESDDDPGNQQLISILADRIRETIRESGLDRPRVAVVDHGSPLNTVTDVRNAIAVALGKVLGSEISALSPASMERRQGDEYAFNEPLLENLLRKADWVDGDVVVSMLFLSPGRHAGPGGDIATICQDASSEAASLKTHMTDLIGNHSEIVNVLASRLQAAATAL